MMHRNSRPAPDCHPVAAVADPGDPALPVAGTGVLSRVRRSTRGRWRALVLGAVHLVILLHVLHFLGAGRSLSPVEPSEAMYTLERGELNAGFVFFALALLSTAIFGRFFCGWGCHLVALQDLCGWLMRRLGIRPRPFRSRLLAWAPAVVAFYMFAWPTLRRWIGGGEVFPGLTPHLVTSGFWDTFPGPVFAVLTLAGCGFLAVYLLGAKGFCTYACPYGALFGAMDRVAPGRIRVTDACDGCGHCTVTCTSNVRVHHEVRRHGMVVDAGCMKCMDCVSVCPKHALYFGFGRRRPWSPAASAASYPLTLFQEVGVAALALGATLAFRGLYDGPPLLLSVALGAMTGFAGWQLVTLLRGRTARLQSLTLSRAGRWTPAGRLFAAAAGLWLLFTAHSGFVQWQRLAARHDIRAGGLTRERVLDPAFDPAAITPEQRRRNDRAEERLRRADRWGLAEVLEIKLGRAWTALVRGDLAAAEVQLSRGLSLAPGRRDLRADRARVLQRLGRTGDAAAELEIALRGGEAPAVAWFELGALYAKAERWQPAVEAYRRGLAAGPGRAVEARGRYDLGGALRRQGRIAEAVVELSRARELDPRDAATAVELGLAFLAQQRLAPALEELERGVQLSPDSVESRRHLDPLIRDLRERLSASGPPEEREP